MPAGSDERQPEVLSVPDLSRRTGIGEKTLREAIRRGDLPAYRVGSKRFRVLWPEFLAWLRTTRVERHAE